MTTLRLVWTFFRIGVMGEAQYRVNFAIQVFQSLLGLVTALAGLGIILNAAYLLWMIQRVLLGPLNSQWAEVPDVDRREVMSLAPLVVLTILAGVLPAILIATFNNSLMQIVRAVAMGG